VVDVFTRFPRKSRHRLGKFGARLVALVLADIAKYPIGRFRRALNGLARIAGSHWPDLLKNADR
jgi:hypothetical protein